MNKETKELIIERFEIEVSNNPECFGKATCWYTAKKSKNNWVIIITEYTDEPNRFYYLNEIVRYTREVEIELWKKYANEAGDVFAENGNNFADEISPRVILTIVNKNTAEYSIE